MSKQNTNGNGKMTAKNLREALWNTMSGVRSGAIQPERANAVASQAREILRSVKVQLQVLAHTRRKAPGDLRLFAHGQEQ